MSARYEVRVYNQSGALQAVLTDWLSLRYRKLVNNVGVYDLEVDGNVSVVNQFVLDGRIEVSRYDLAASPAIPVTIDFTGLHRDITREVLDSGEQRARSRGASFEHLLMRRAVLYPKGSPEADKSGAGETVMKSYVNENAGPGASATPRLFAGVIPGFTIEADQGRGTAWQGSRSHRNLLEVLREIADATGIDFEVVASGATGFQFRARPSPLGADRTTIGLNTATGLNAAGNPPVVFSLEHGNMQAPRYSLSRMQESNAIIILGQGIEDDRVVIERTSAATGDSPLNRFESIHDGSGEDENASLEDIGDALLEKLQAREAFTFQTMQIPGLLYGRDYFVGDNVTARFGIIERNKQIIGVEITVAEGREDISIIVGDVR